MSFKSALSYQVDQKYFSLINISKYLIKKNFVLTFSIKTIKKIFEYFKTLKKWLFIVLNFAD